MTQRFNTLAEGITINISSYINTICILGETEAGRLFDFFRICKVGFLGWLWPEPTVVALAHSKKQNSHWGLTPMRIKVRINR